jgi:Spy/CpxP family protein refolding chaperone
MRTISTFLLTAALVFAQGRGNAPDPATFVQHRVSSLTTLLSLNTAQQQQATTIFTNAATTQGSLRASLKTSHQGLQEAVQKNDIATIDQESATIGNLTAQMTSTQAKADAAFYQILTPDQQTKFTQAESQGGFGRGRGPGGFHGGN